MVNSPNQHYNRYERIAELVSLILALGLFVFIAKQVHPSIFHFRFNPYAYASLLSALSNFILLIYMGRLRTKTSASYWFTFFLVSITLWSFSEFFQRLSVTREAALFWSTLAAIGWTLLPVCIFVFSLTYLHKERLLTRPHVFYGLIITTLGFLYLVLTTDALIPFTQAQLTQTAWGFNSGVEGYFPFFLLWFETLYLVPVFLMYRFFRASQRPSEKKQALFFMAALLIPCIFGTFTDAILPILNITFYPVTVTLTSVMALLLTYAVRRYGLLVFNPATVAGSILETIDEMVIVLNPIYEIEFLNIRTEEILGLTQQKLIGLPISALFQTTFQQIQKKLLQPLITNRFSHLEQIEINALGDKKVPVSISAARVLDESGDVKGYILVLSDTTKLRDSFAALQREKESVEAKVVERTREAVESKAQLLASINSLRFGFAMVDAHFDLLLMNQSLGQLLASIPGNPLINEKNLADIEQQFGKIGLHKAAVECLRSQEPCELPNIFIAGIYVHIYISPITINKKSIGVVLLFQDVTERTVLERSRDEFFSIASHEMRTPLTAIGGYASLLKSLYSDKLADEQFSKMTDGILEGSKRLIRIVNDFLNMSRLEQGKLPFLLASFPIAPLLTDVAQEMRALISQKGLRLILHTPHKPTANAFADSDRVREVLVNLIGNSLKFTDTGSITISLEQADTELIIRVHDTGKGIHPEQQSLLFRKFQQAGPSLIARDASHGTGLGLYISKLVIEGMGGCISLESSHPSQGSTFAFTLPFARSDQTA